MKHTSFTVLLTLLLATGVASSSRAADATPLQPLDVHASSSHENYTPDKAIDGVINDASRWVSAASEDPAWLELQFDEVAQLAGIHLFIGYGEGSPIESFTVQFWRDDQWVDIPSAAVTGNQATALALPFDDTVEVITDRLRLWVTGTPNDMARVKEIIVWPGPEAMPGLPVSLDFQTLLQPVPRTARFEQDGYYVWCGTMQEDADGVCHLLFSRWPKSSGFDGWISHSEIGYATAEHPTGPYTFQKLALTGAGDGAWDSHSIHNPSLHFWDGKYYLYHTGVRADDVAWRTDGPLSDKDWWICRNRQRIGVAVADHPGGPWTRFDAPVLDVSPSGWDSMLVSNPAVTRTPDGRFLMVYKAVGPGPNRVGRVVHGVAFADQPTGPFQKEPNPIFTREGVTFPAEDPFIWHEDGRYRAIVKDMGGHFTGAGQSLALFESADGIDWRLSAHPLVSTCDIRWAGGATERVNRLERPQLHFRNGQPATLLCAVLPSAPGALSYNVQIPLGAAATER